MNVALIHFSLNFLGGAEKLCLATIKALERRGHQVTLITVEKTDWTALRNSFAAINKPDREIYFTPAKLSKRLSNPIIALTLYLAYLSEHILARLGGKYDVTLSTFGDLVCSIVDIVYVHFPLQGSQEYAQILPITNVSKWRFQSKLYTLSLQMFHKIPARIILVNSRFIQRIVTSVLQSESKVVNPPVDVAYFLQTNEKQLRQNVIVTVSGYSPKRHLEIIPTIASYVESGKFLIVGKTDAYSSATLERLKIKIAESRVEGHVKLLTNIARSKLKELLAHSKIYLHAMPNEHFGTAIVEAMAAGCVPVVHKSGGPWSDILGEKQGEYGYSYETPEEASRYIDLLLKDEALRLEIASRAVKRSMIYDVSVFEKKIVEIVECINS